MNRMGSGRVRFVKVDTDENEQLASTLAVTLNPTPYTLILQT